MKKLILLSFIFVSLLSCNDERVDPSNPALVLMNLKVGSYLVYDWYEIDVENNVTILNKRDSAIIEKDTLIDGRTYFIKKSNFFGGQKITKTILFDSANSIYSFPDRNVILTLDRSLIATEKFGLATDPIAIGYYSIDDNKVPIEVPAGNFNAVNFRGRIEPQQPDYPYGIRYNDNYYADNIGLVKMRTQFYSEPGDVEMRLVKYGSIR